MFLEVYPQVLGVSTLKYCPKCENVYPATDEYFHLNSRSKDGFAFRCKDCAKQVTREWNAANRERQRANTKRWRDANPDRVKAINAAYHEANRDRLLPKYREASREWYQANKERRHDTAQAWRKANPERRKAKDREWALANPNRMRAAQQKWAKANPDKERIRHQRRRARKANATGAYTPADIEAIRVAQGNRCYLCGVELLQYHVDHFIPLSKGGTNEPGNLRLACPKCNLSKGAKHPHDMGRLI